MKTKVCKICGAEFIPNIHQRKCCSAECTAKNNKSNDIIASREQRIKRKVAKRKKSNGINEVNAKAKAAGMSYGQYRAMMILESVPKINTEVAK